MSAAVVIGALRIKFNVLLKILNLTFNTGIISGIQTECKKNSLDLDQLQQKDLILRRLSADAGKDLRKSCLYQEYVKKKSWDLKLSQKFVIF